MPLFNSKMTGSIFGWIAVITSTAAILPSSAHACIVYVPLKLEDVSYADVVVIGHIDNYRIIRNEAFRKQRLALPDLPEDLRKTYQDPKQSLMSDYARFDVQVEEVLAGQASGRLSVTWDASTFAEPDEIAPGRYLIALRRPGSASPPLRSPSATILPSPDTNALTLLQAPCSGAFIYPAESDAVQNIRGILRAPQR